MPEPERPTGDRVVGVARNHHGDDWLTDEERAQEDRAVGVPHVAVGHSEPISEHLPEEIKQILRKSRTRASFDDQGNRLQ